MYVVYWSNLNDEYATAMITAEDLSLIQYYSSFIRCIMLVPGTEDIEAEHPLEMIDVKLSQVEPTDLRGLPKLTGEYRTQEVSLGDLLQRYGRPWSQNQPSKRYPR